MIYIVIVTAVVASLLLAGLSAVDWGGLFPSGADPTPDYNVDQIAIQETVVAENPEDAEAHALLASMMANSGRMQDAIPEYEKALELDPENATIRLDFARSLQSNNMPEDAEAQFLRVLEQQPDNHTAHYYLGRLYLDWHPSRQDDAERHFQRVIEIAPDSFLAEQAELALDAEGESTPDQYDATPIASPMIPQ